MFNFHLKKTLSCFSILNRKLMPRIVAKQYHPLTRALPELERTSTAGFLSSKANILAADNRPF